MRDIAERFAGALDRDDFFEAESLLGPDCSYHLNDRQIRGRSEVMQSFIDASTWAHTNIERVIFTHTLERSDERMATIRFVDEFEHRGARIVHECRMHLALGEDGQIDELILEEPPGERERIMTLLREARVSI